MLNPLLLKNTLTVTKASYKQNLGREHMGISPRDIALNMERRLHDVTDSVQLRYRRGLEIKKYEDKRRRAIYEKIELTAEQKRAIDELYLKNYGEKIPYTWHRHYTAFTGCFDVKYFPELLYIPEFERFCNIYPEFVKAFCDKNLLPYVVKGTKIKMPQTLLSSTRGYIKDIDDHPVTHDEALGWLSNAGEIFAKPSTNTGSGVGCALFHMKNGTDEISGRKADEILKSLGKDFVIQERIKCSEDVRKLHNNSCNTFRVITYRWKNSIRSLPVIMRIGRNNNHVDNAHAGGVFIGVSSEGLLKRSAFTEFNEQFTSHPDSEIVFENYKINGFKQVVNAAIDMHNMLPQLGVVHWDFTIDETNSPMLIEANPRGGSIWFIQMAHGAGMFGDNTEEVLQWMREMKKRKSSQREEIAFGNL